MKTQKSAEAHVSCKLVAVMLPYFKMLDTMKSITEHGLHIA
jgi:hypothetical protein